MKGGYSMELVLTILFQYIRESPSSDTGVCIAKILIQNLDKIHTLSLEGMADLCLCSPSTFTRFLKTLGIENFKELRKMISFPKNVYMTNGFDANEYSRHITYNIQEINQTLTQSQIRNFALDIYNARRVIILTFPTNYFPLLDFQCKMMMNGKFIEVLSYLQKEQELSSLDCQDLVIVISFQGNFFIENHIRDKLNTSHVKKILITQSLEKQYNDFCTVIKCGSFSYYGESLYSLMYLLNLLNIEYKNLISGK